MLRHKRNDGDLSWYYSEGLASFERSTFGPMLERAKLFGLPSTPHRRRGPLTVQPKSGGSGGEPSYEPQIETLLRYGDVSRRLARIEASDPKSVQVLELYHGDEGAKWAVNKRGRWVALYPLTRDGKVLIDWARETAKPAPPELANREGYRGLSDFDRLDVIMSKDAVKNDPGTRALIESAQRQAISLQMRADDAWLWSGLEQEPLQVPDAWERMLRRARELAA
jgi:hypothetical protein